MGCEKRPSYCFPTCFSLFNFSSNEIFWPRFVLRLSVRLRIFHTFYFFSRTIGPSLTRLDKKKKACYQEKRIFNSLNKRGRCISKAEIITASMCNEDWHGYDSKLFIDYTCSFNAANCDHSSVQASSSSYPQIKFTVTYHWYFRIIYSQIWNIDSIGLMIFITLLQLVCLTTVS